MSDSQIKSIIKRLERLEKEVFRERDDVKTKARQKTKNNGINYSLNERAFALRYAKGKSGPKKFTILIAFLSKGKIGCDVALRDIEALWNKMKAKDFLGAFNRKYSSKAKNNGWVNSRGTGLYYLTDEWRNVLGENK